MESDEEDPIDAFFRGKIVNVKGAKPTINSSRNVEIEETVKWRRNVKESAEMKVTEERKLLQKYLKVPVEEIDGTLGIEECEEKRFIKPDLVHQKYEFRISRQKLPIESKHREIMHAIRTNKVIILKGETGTGKSSQIPQFILEDCYAAEPFIPCNIIVTQPKKISAISLAQRVAFERKCEVGSLVGYQVGLDKKMDPNDTKILFCTTGVFLQKLVHYKSLQKWSHIIIDEIHERDLNMDMVLLIVRRLLIATKSETKIILMSATVNCQKLADYFRVVQETPYLSLNIPKPFAIQLNYLNDIEHLGVTRDYIDMTTPALSNKMLRLGADLVEFLVHKGAESFLVFLPGIFEIDSFHRELQSIKREHFNIDDFTVFILHSTIPLTNLKGLYDASKKKKIVLSTNISESSITIPGIQVIIDYCLEKYMEVDSASSLTQLKLSWTSKMSLEQRAGRCGRTCPGQIIRLIYSDQYKMLPDETKSEMQRTSLENVVLKVKNLEMGKPSNILAIALDPPKRSAVIDAILMLKESGAMTRFMEKKNEFDFLDGHLTYAGSIMSKLPMDIRLSKLIVLGYVFSVLNECIVIAAGLSVGKIFHYENSMNAFETKLTHDTTSDLIAIMYAYFKYNDWVRNNKFSNSSKIEERWCKNHMLNYRNVKEMKALIKDIKNRLKEFNILEDDFRYTKDEKVLVIKMCIAGAFYPNYYNFGGDVPAREEFKHTFNKNLCSTVFFQTKNSTKNGHLYEKQFQNVLYDAEIINCSDDANIMFDSNSQKIFVEFNNLRDDSEIKMPGDVKLEVYKALKFRSLKNRDTLKIFMMSPENEEMFSPSEQRRDIYNREYVSSELKLKANLNIYPSLSLKPHQIGQFLFGEITHIISPTKFYFQPKKAFELLGKLKRNIINNLQKITNIDEKIEFDRIMVQKNNEFYRGQILEYPSDDHTDSYKVLFIDFGTVIECSMDEFYTGRAANQNQRQDLLRDFFKLPAMCYECRLSEIQPTSIQQYGWNKKAIEEFKAVVSRKIIQLNLFAFNFYDKIASVEILARHSPISSPINVAANLVHKGLAVYSNESYVAMISKALNDNSQAMKYAVHKTNKQLDIPPQLLDIPCELLGPFSPLETSGRLQRICRSEEHNIIIDHSSINCALLDPYPYDGIKKLLVASTKSMTNRGNIVTLSQTTVIPFIKGISIIVALLFSACAEIRHNSDKTRFTSILTGLGCDFLQKPYYGEHDCLIRTDAEFDNEDINMINDVRQEMSIIMQQNLNEHFENQRNPMNIIQQSRARVCSLILKIVKKERLQLGEVYSDGFTWKDWIKKKLDHQKLFPMIDAIQLNDISRDEIKRMNHNFRELEQKAKINQKDESVKCLACGDNIETIADLKIHLIKIKHIQLKAKYENLDRNYGSASRNWHKI